MEWMCSAEVGSASLVRFADLARHLCRFLTKRLAADLATRPG